MTIIRDKTAISLTEEECEAIKTVAELTYKIYCGLNDTEMKRFNDIMKASRGNADNSDIEISILDLFCILDDFQMNIDEFNS